MSRYLGAEKRPGHSASEGLGRGLQCSGGVRWVCIGGWGVRQQQGVGLRLLQRSLLTSRSLGTHTVTVGLNGSYPAGPGPATNLLSHPNTGRLIDFPEGPTDVLWSFCKPLKLHSKLYTCASVHVPGQSVHCFPQRLRNTGLNGEIYIWSHARVLLPLLRSRTHAFGPGVI